MSKTTAQLYEDAVQRNMKRFRTWTHTFKPAFWNHNRTPLEALAKLKHSLGIKNTDTRFDNELQGELNA